MAPIRRDDGLPIGDGDELMARITALEPARGTPPLSKRMVRSLVRGATATPRRAPTWTWPKYRLATLGALVGSSALVVGGILGLDSLGSLQVATPVFETTVHPPTPPAVQYARASAAYGVEWDSVSAGCPIALQFQPASSAVHARGPAHATAYQIASTLTPRRAVLALAPDFGLATTRLLWFPRGAHDRGWWVGSVRGRSLTTYSSEGITWWSYLGSIVKPQRLLAEVAHGQRLLSDAASTTRALRLLANFVPRTELGSPSTFRTRTTVHVTVPLAVRGVFTDERFELVYQPKGQLATAIGPLATVVRAVRYPTIAPMTAAQRLRFAVGPLVGLASPSSTGSSPSAGTPLQPTSALNCGDTTTPRPVTGTAMTLSMRELPGGVVWLLPSWTFSGLAIHAAPFFGAPAATSSIAVDPKYLEYLRAVVARPTHKHAG